MNILIVDDEADIRHLFEQRFRKELRAGELVFHFALSAPEALDLLERNAQFVTLILSDINMPGMSGLELLRTVKERYHHLKVILISAYSGQDYRTQAIQYGCDDYFTKPIDFTELRSRVFA